MNKLGLPCNNSNKVFKEKTLSKVIQAGRKSKSGGKKVKHYGRRLKMMCGFMILTLLLNATPAMAVPIIIAAGGEFGQDVRYAAISSSPLATRLMNGFLFFISPSSKKKKNQLNKISVLPGDVKISQGETVNYSAIGYTADNSVVSGLEVKWLMQDKEQKTDPRPLPNGVFTSDISGDFLIIAESEGVRAQTEVNVSENVSAVLLKKLEMYARAGKNDQADKIKSEGSFVDNEISSKNIYQSELTGDKPPVSSSEIKKGGPSTEDSETENSAPPMMRPPDDHGWGNGNWWTSDDPGNQVGNPPGSSPQASAGNGNFQLIAPLVTLPGRGIDVNLSLTYNSRLWSKSGNQMSYDSDSGFPAPGWSFGFGKMMFMGTAGGCMLVDADGTRRSYTGSVSSYTYGGSTSTSFTGYTTDGTFIDYNCSYSSNQYGTWFSGSARLSNGTSISYNSATSNGQQAFPTHIVDSQGNYITMTYRNGRGPAIETVTDTMGRVVTFDYDGLNRLISVNVPKFGNAGSRSVVRLHYKQLTLNPGFASPLTVDTANSSPYVLDAIYYPATGTGYWFNDADSYSSYGMIAKVLEQRAMNWSAGPDTQGTVTPGLMSRQETYNYPLTPNYTLGDAPTFTTSTESWDGMDTAAAVTTYEIFNNATPRVINVTQPNGVKTKQTSFNTPGQWNDGLIYQDETLDAANNLLNKSVVTWQEGAYHTPRPAQVTTTDEGGNASSTGFTYGASYNQLISKKEYNYDQTLYREYKTEFENHGSYTTRHIFNLVKTSEVYDGQNNRLSRTDYQYDNNAVVNGTGDHNLRPAPNVIKHYSTHDPYTTETYEYCVTWQYHYPECSDGIEYAYVGPPPQYMVHCPSARDCVETANFSVYDSSTLFRGNLTKKTSYADAANLTGAVSENLQYDITGNLVATSTMANQATTYNYEVSTQFAYPTSQTEGSTDPNSPHRNASSMAYDFNTGLTTQATDKNGRTNTVTYNPDSLRPTITTASTGAYFKHFYDDAAMTTTEEHYDANNNLAGKGIKYLNGVGKIKREDSLGANNIWDIIETKYTNLKEIWKQSRPYRTGDQIQWTENIYDILGRTKEVIEPDGSSVKAYFNESQRPDSASVLPGPTVRVADAWGRERWERYDVSGKLAELVEPNPNGNGLVFGSGSLQTKYKTDVLGRLIETEQGDQIRSFKYDSLGQLTRQKLAEQTATLNDSGAYVGAGNAAAKWGEAFLYDGQSNLILKTDARGVRTYYSFQIDNAQDPLNRIQARYYDLSGPLEPNLPIHQSSYISYEYKTTGDKLKVKKIRTHGILTEDFTYDVEGRVTDYTQTIDYRQNYPMTISYLYDSLDRVIEVRDPAQYGLNGSPRKLIQNNFDIAGRLTNINVNGQQQLGNINYDAASRATTLKIGVSGSNQVTENYSYNAQNGLLENQQIIRNGTSLLDLTYDYQRNGSPGTINGKTGHLTQIINNLDFRKNRSYQYDAVGRLISAKGGNNLWEEQYSYDRYGNRTNVTASGYPPNSPKQVPRDGIPNLTYHSTSNRISTTGYEYDSAGNQTRSLSSDGVNWVRYEYDTANRIQLIKKDDGTMLEAFQYGASNSRLMSADYTQGLTTMFASEGGSTVAEYTEFNHTIMTWTKGYTYVGGKVLSTSVPNGTGGETFDFHHSDQLGSRVITNQQTGTSFEQVNLPFGTALAAESSGSTNKRFTSYERSGQTGLDYAVNRTYDSKLGRFTQVDPIGISSVDLSNPQTLNLYSYCANDPINHTDPDGLFFGFLKKLFSWISKILKYIAFVVAVVVAIITITLMPATAALWFKIFTVVGSLASAASSVFEILGLKTLATIFGIIGAVGSFGTSFYDKAGQLFKNVWKAGTKAILGVIKAGANLASKILSAAGHSLASNILGIVSAVAGAIDGLLEEKKVNDIVLKGNDGNPLLKWKASPWQWFKAIRGISQKIAAAAGASRLAMILDNFGLPEDVESIYGGIKALSHPFKPATYDDKTKTFTWKGLVLSQSAETDRIIKWENRVGRFTFYTSNIGKINDGLANILKKVNR